MSNCREAVSDAELATQMTGTSDSSPTSRSDWPVPQRRPDRAIVVIAFSTAYGALRDSPLT